MELKIELQDGWKPNECDFCIDPYTSGPKEPCSKDCPLVVAWEKLQAEEKSKPAPVEAKATAEGSLVEELRFLEGDGNDKKIDGNYWRDILTGILSRYRPASPAVNGKSIPCEFGSGNCGWLPCREDINKCPSFKKNTGGQNK